MNQKTESNLELISGEIAALPENFYGTVELRFHNGLLAIVQTTSSKKFNEYLDRSSRKVTNDKYQTTAR
jgi:hypothetical protein